MKVGDIVVGLAQDPWGEEATWHTDVTGLIIRVIKDVEYPPLIEVLWDDGYVSKVCQDELGVLNEGR